MSSTDPSNSLTATDSPPPARHDSTATETEASEVRETNAIAFGEPARAQGTPGAHDGPNGETGTHAAEHGEGASAADGADDGDGGEASEGEATEGGAPEAGAADGGATAPKKRRRRRKKKGGAAAAGPAGEHADGQSAPPHSGAKAQGSKPPASRASKRPRKHRANDRAPFHVGEEVFGKVTAVLETAVMVDLSGKALAIFDRTEMEPDDLVPSPGDRFVARVHQDGSRGGLVVLTRKPLREEESKPKLEQAAENGTLVGGLVTGVIKGGVEVDLGGVRAFAPASGMDLHPANANFSSLVGQRLEFKVSQFDKAGRDVVVTRRPMLEAEAHERRKHALSLLTEGQVMTGVVRTVVDWGVFVALPEAENVEGLIHATEASHDPRPYLAELFKPGDRFDVKILQIDERGKIWLSRKALVEDPWGSARQKFAPGSRHTGKVVRLEKFGAFIELEPGMDGLLHVTDLSFDRVEHPNEVLKEGQELEVVIHYFDIHSKKIGLHPAPPADRADEAPQKIARGGLVKAAVVKGEAAGLVVRVLGVTGRAARGFIPAGQTGTPRGTDLRKSFKPGTVLDLKVLEVDPRSGEPKLSIRGFKDDEEKRAHREYRQKLKAEGGFGTLGDLLRKKLAGASDAAAASSTDEKSEE
ncbi:MAG TPA: S1 RNA-binding domain-containing protein [Polyangiaceae bacterium]|nr:S1 RNA-binding domain-containing protein [Polyangiaceae bacterium]